MKLSVIIVNYNVKHFLEQALLSVRKAARDIDAEVFVVDNNSVDDSVAMVREKFPEVQLIANQHNAGFSSANNQAIRQAAGEYILLLNPDTVVKEDTFEKCLAFLDAQPSAGALGVKMIDGSGKFLPESKRGFPSPLVAFWKTFGLSRLFPRSRIFNRYHLGYLPEDETNEVEVLAGAFMLIRASVLSEIGLLDESFFMYGEDIDLSYRIVQAGYRNIYFPETTIIHYKGESTKKGSLNYVRTFYKAMIIFARKHFRGEKARLFVIMLQLAIYFRATLTLVSSVFRKAYLPLLDALVIYLGLVFLKNFWATYHFRDPDYYEEAIMYVNFPLYVLIWLTSVYFSGGYEEKHNLRRLVRGLMLGTILLAAVYGFLELEYRSSRALILLGAAWAVISTVLVRLGIHFLQYGNLNVGKERSRNLVIVGSNTESTRVQQLLVQAGVSPNFIGTVSPTSRADSRTYLSALHQLDEVVHIYRINEVIFCSQDVSSRDIMHWMTKLGPGMEYKIVPKESLSIIGSTSRNSSGELYTIDIRFKIAYYLNRRNKRLIDVLLALFFLVSFPLHWVLVTGRWQFLKNATSVLTGRLTWVGYHVQEDQLKDLPPLRNGILSPVDGLMVGKLNDPTIRRLNFLYAKDYSIGRDLDIIWNGYRSLGRRSQTGMLPSRQ